MKGSDLKREKIKRGTDTEMRIDKWVDDLKSEFDDIDINTKQIPIVILKNGITNLPIYIDDEYRLTDSFNNYTNSPSQTLNKLNEWIKNGEFECDVWLLQTI